MHSVIKNLSTSHVHNPGASHYKQISTDSVKNMAIFIVYLD